MADRWVRFGRGWFIAGVATYAAAFSHVAADGGQPPAIAIVLALAFSGPVCIALAGRLSRRRLAIAVGVSQFLYHGLFALFGASGSHAAPSPFSSHHHALVIDPTMNVTANSVAIEPAMVLMHCAAAAVTVLVMLYTERTTRAALSAIRPLLSTVLRAALRGLRAALAAASTGTARPLRLTAQWLRRIPAPGLAPLIGFLRHRGPPARTARA